MIRIVSDSTCDLSPELIKRYSIEIVPLCIELGDREYLDGYLNSLGNPDASGGIKAGREP